MTAPSSASVRRPEPGTRVYLVVQDTPYDSGGACVWQPDDDDRQCERPGALSLDTGDELLWLCRQHAGQAVALHLADQMLDLPLGWETP